jgi:hypothetical protein
VTWKLKPNVKWSDGTDFTAEDVIFTYAYLADERTAATDARYARGVERVEAVDPFTLRVTWQEPNPYPYQLFTSLFGHILQKKQFQNFTAGPAKDAPGNLAPIGTGPYKVREFKPGDIVAYDINPLSREADKPFFKEVHLQGGGDATSAARAVLQTGDVDYAWNLQVEAQVLRQLAEGAQGELITARGTMVERLLPMISRRLTRSLAVAAALIVVGGGAFGIVTANSNSVSGNGTAATPTPGQLIPFTQGQPSPTQVVGQIPASYVQGGGTIVTGTAADTATAAAVAAYHGGTVDRGAWCGQLTAIMLFVNSNFTAIGAE